MNAFTFALLVLAMMVFSMAITWVKTKLVGRSTMKKEYWNLMFSYSLFKLTYVMVPLVLFEEGVFRLGLIGWFGGRTSHFWIAASILGFALLHIPNYKRDGALFMLISHLGSASLLTYVYLAHGFFTVVLFHLVYNACAIGFSRLYYLVLFPNKLAEIKVATT